MSGIFESLKRGDIVYATGNEREIPGIFSPTWHLVIITKKIKGENLSYTCRDIDTYRNPVNVITEQNFKEVSEGRYSLRIYKNLEKEPEILHQFFDGETEETNLYYFENSPDGKIFEKFHLQTETLCMEAVKKDPMLLKYVLPEYQTKEIITEAVKRNGLALGAVGPITGMISSAEWKAIRMEAVKSNGLALEFVRIKDFDLCDTAIRQNPEAIKFVPVALKPVFSDEKTYSVNPIKIDRIGIFM